MVVKKNKNGKLKKVINVKKDTAVKYLHKGELRSIGEIAKMEKLDENSLRKYLKQDPDLKKALRQARKNKKHAKEIVSQIPYHGEVLTYHAIAKRVHVNAALLKTYHIKTKDIDQAVELARAARENHEEKTKTYSYMGSLKTKHEIVEIEGLNEEEFDFIFHNYHDLEKSLVVAKTRKSGRKIVSIGTISLRLETIAFLTNHSPLYLESLEETHSELDFLFDATEKNLIKTVIEEDYSLPMIWNGYRNLKKPLQESILLCLSKERRIPKIWIEEKYGKLFDYWEHSQSLEVKEIISRMLVSNENLENTLVRYLLSKDISLSLMEQEWLFDIRCLMQDIGNDRIEEFESKYLISNSEKKVLQLLEEKLKPYFRMIILDQFAKDFEKTSFEQLIQIARREALTEEEIRLALMSFFIPFGSSEGPNAHERLLNALFFQYLSFHKTMRERLCLQYKITIQEKMRMEFLGDKMEDLIEQYKRLYL